MTERAEHLAKEAKRLQEDPIFNKALHDIRQEAFEALAAADAADQLTILRLQQRAKIAEEIRDMLTQYITQGKSQDAGTFV